MKITLKEKIEMCEDHFPKGKSLSDVSEMYDGDDRGNPEHIINLHKGHII